MQAHECDERQFRILLEWNRQKLERALRQIMILDQGESYACNDYTTFEQGVDKIAQLRIEIEQHLDAQLLSLPLQLDKTGQDQSEKRLRVLTKRLEAYHKKHYPIKYHFIEQFYSIFEFLALAYQSHRNEDSLKAAMPGLFEKLQAFPAFGFRCKLPAQAVFTIQSGFTKKGEELIVVQLSKYEAVTETTKLYDSYSKQTTRLYETMAKKELTRSEVVDCLVYSDSIILLIMQDAVFQLQPASDFAEFLELDLYEGERIKHSQTYRQQLYLLTTHGRIFTAQLKNFPPANLRNSHLVTLSEYNSPVANSKLDWFYIDDQGNQHAIYYKAEIKSQVVEVKKFTGNFTHLETLQWQGGQVQGLAAYQGHVFLTTKTKEPGSGRNVVIILKGLQTFKIECEQFCFGNDHAYFLEPSKAGNQNGKLELTVQRMEDLMNSKRTLKTGLKVDVDAKLRYFFSAHANILAIQSKKREMLSIYQFVQTKNLQQHAE